MSEDHRRDPTEYVRENQDLLVRLLKHGDDEFVRALALAALVKYGTDPELEAVQRELEAAQDKEGEGM